MKKHPHATCPACGEGELHSEEFVSEVEYRGTRGKIRQIKLKCDHCRADLFDEKCGKENRRAYVRFQKKVEGIPTGEQIRDLRRRLNLTSERAGEILGGGPKAFSKYENEEIVPRGAMRTLIKYLLAHPDRLDEILESNGHKSQPSKARVRSLAGHAPERVLVASQIGGPQATRLFESHPFLVHAAAIRAAEVFSDRDLLVAMGSTKLDVGSMFGSHVYATSSATLERTEDQTASRDLVIAEWAANRAARA